MVSCKDYAGQPVVWKGPKGLLGPRTRPRVEDRSVGKLLVFNDTKIEDTGEYFCSTLRKDETKTFKLIIEGKVRRIISLQLKAYTDWLKFYNKLLSYTRVVLEWI